VLTHHGVDSPALAPLLSGLGNVTLVERPTRVPALVSAVRSALRARRRQYEIRAHLAERLAAESRMQLELAVSRALAHPGTPRERLAATLALLGEALRWSAGLVWELDGDDWRCRARWHAGEPLPPWLVRASLPGSDAAALARRAVADGTPLFLAHRPGADAGNGQVSGHAAVLPLAMGLSVVGVLIAYRDAAFADDERPAMVRIAGRVGQFIAHSHAEEALRRSEANLSDFFENAPIGLNWMDAAGRIVRANRAELDLLGYGEHEYVGRQIADFHVDPAVAEDLLARLGRGETVHDLPARLRARDGSVRDVRINCNVLWEHGHFVHSRSFTYDITARARAETLLRERTSLLQAISAGTSDLIYVKDRQGRLVLGNAALFALIGAEEQVIGRTVDELVPDPAQARRIGDSDREVMTTGTAQVVEEEFGPPGAVMTLLSTKAPYRDEHGEIIGLLAISRDISDRKRIELSLREADRRKDEFLATLAHELRNPLAPIRSAAELLRVRGTATDVARAREVIDRQARLLTRLVDDLLDVSRITRGKIVLHRAPVALAEVVAAAVETSRPLLDAARHTLTLTLPPQPVWIDADAVRIGQSISNLLNNAAKFTPPGGTVTLAVSLEGSDVLVRVRDTGVGIAPSALASVFDLFAQADASTERAPGGLGIGLHLVRSFVEMHGGTVTACSAGPGLGSEFVIRLPRLRREPEVWAAPAAPAPAPAEDGHRILVVDDNEDGAESLSLLLELMGNQVRTAHDGLAAVESAAEFAPHVVLLDLGLPKLNGYEAARRIRALAGGADMLLIALTGWGSAVDRQRSRAAGFDHHLVKPVDMAALRQILAHVRRRPQRRSSPAAEAAN
jgi:PAS domain S-box-containing protein